MADRLERELLLLAGRLALGTAPDAEALPYVRSPLNWTRLFERAAGEGMSGLLAAQLQRLTRLDRRGLPPTLCTQAHHHIFARNGAFFAELAALRKELQQHGHQVILLKGGALIETVYQGHLGLRPLSDLDLLVRASDLPCIKAILLRRGFHPASPSSTFFTNGPTAFDLHTDLIGATRIRRRALAFQFDAEALWREATQLDARDPTVLVLSMPQQFLHLTVHTLKHSFSRLIWLVDLALVWQRLQWAELMPQAIASGTLRPLAYVLWSLERLMGVEMPAHVWAALPQLSKVEKLFLEAVAQRRDMGALGEVMGAFSIPEWRRRLGYLLEFGFPNRHVLAEVFPTTPAWLVYPRRLSQLCAIGLRQSGRSLLALGKRRQAWRSDKSHALHNLLCMLHCLLYIGMFFETTQMEATPGVVPHITPG